MGIQSARKLFATRVSLILFVVLFTLTSCSGGGGGDSSGTAGRGDSKAPSFAGVVLTTPNDTDKVTLAWEAASDDNTPAQEMTYSVHYAQNADFAPSASTLYKKVEGETQLTITGLTAGSTYYFLVIATDRDGNESATYKYVMGATMKAPVILSDTTPLLQAQDIGLVNPTINGSNFTFAYTGKETLPTTGSILIGEDSTGAGYLVKVVGAFVSGNQLVVQTTDGSLDEVIKQGEIRNTITLFDVSETDSQVVAAGLVAGQSSASNDKNVVQWSNKLLRVEQFTETNQNGLSVKHTQGTNRYLVKPAGFTSGATFKAATGSVSEEFVYDVNLDFTPDLQTDCEWEVGLGGVSLTKGELLLSGTLSMDATAKYNFTDERAFEKEYVFTAFTRKYRMRYMVGSVPVWQDITFTLTAQLSSTATAAIDANAESNMTRKVEFGVRYNPVSNVWEPISPQTSKAESFKADLSVKGGVDSEIRLIPNVEVKFYRAVAADLSLEPYISNSIQAEMVENADFLEGYFPPGITQLTTFDASLGAECFVGANLSILSKKYPVLSKTKVCEIPIYDFFSLPELNLTQTDQGEGLGEFLLEAEVVDGGNDPFNNSSIKWNFYPADVGTLTVDSNPRKATFQFNNSDQKATVFFSGYGKLGEIGRQFVNYEISSNAITYFDMLGESSIIDNSRIFNSTRYTEIPGGSSDQIRLLYNGSASNSTFFLVFPAVLQPGHYIHGDGDYAVGEVPPNGIRSGYFKDQWEVGNTIAYGCSGNIDIIYNGVNDRRISGRFDIKLCSVTDKSILGSIQGIFDTTPINVPWGVF